MSYSIRYSASYGAQTSTGTLPVWSAPVSIQRIDAASRQPTPTTPTAGKVDPQSPVVSNTEEFTVGQFSADIFDPESTVVSNTEEFTVGQFVVDIFDPESSVVSTKNEEEFKAAQFAADIAEAENPKPSYYEAQLDFSMGDIGNAERLVNYWGETTRYDSDRGTWMIWRGTHWETDSCGQALHRTTLVAKNIIPMEVAAIRKKGELDVWDEIKIKDLKKEAARMHRTPAMLSALMVAKVLPEMRTRTSQYDAHPMKFNCLSGVIDLPTGEVHPHRPEDLHARISQVELAPAGSECPRWMKYLNDIMCGDAELVSYLQRMVGYIMTGSTKESAVFVFWGDGANGKSVFINVIYHLLGGYAHNTDIRTFTNIDRGNSPRNDLAALVGMRFAVSPEWELGEALDEAILKTISGGDIVSARFLNKEQFQFKPVCKVVLASNHRPVVKGTDHGIWRRLRMVPFLAKFEDAMQIKELDKILIAEEGPAILRWAMEGAQIWTKQGLRTPASITEATTEYRGTQDWFLNFLDERCEVDANASVASQSLFNDYRNWCTASNIKAQVKQQTFNERLQRHNFQKKATKVANMWFGLRLKSGPKFVTASPSSDAMLVQHQPSYGGSKVGGDLDLGVESDLT